MTFLPIVERELRVGARRPATYWSRFWVAAAVLALGAMMLLVNPKTVSPSQLAQFIFRAIGGISLAFALLAGVFLTADSLSAEKREGTLGLLFLTDLKGFDVVLGKLASTSLQAFYGLLGVFPILAIPLLMGGVSGREITRLVLTLLTTTLFSLSAGMAVSAGSRETRQAILGTIAVLILVSGVGPALWWEYQIFSHGGAQQNALLYTSPVYSFFLSLDRYYRPAFWWSLAILLMITAGFNLWTCLLVPRIWKERTREAGRGLQGFWRKLRQGGSPLKARGPRPVLGNPIHWLGSRDRSMRRSSLLFIGVLFLLWLCFLVGWLQEPPGGNTDEAFWILLIILFAMHSVIKIMTTIEATRQTAEDLQSGALELLTITTLRDNEMVYGFRRAASEQFAWIKVLVMLCNVVMASLFAFANPLDVNSEERIIFAAILLWGAVLLYTDCFALARVGLQMALRGHRPHRAVLATLKRVMLLPWLGIFLFFVMGFSGFLDDEHTARALVAVWFAGCFILDFIVTVSAQKQLSLGVRRLVARAKFGDEASPPESANAGLAEGLAPGPGYPQVSL